MITIKDSFSETISQLGVDSNSFLNGAATVTHDGCIYLLRRNLSDSNFTGYVKVYPSFSELRKIDAFFLACVKEFAKGTNRVFLSHLCKWYANVEEQCPLEENDLIYVSGDFHTHIVLYKDDRMMTRQALIDGIEQKFRNGYVLDHSKMTCDRIAYENGEFDSIIGYYLPCLVTNDNDDVAVDYFERGEYASPAEQIGIKSCSDYTLDFIQTPYLHHILYAMVKP